MRKEVAVTVQTPSRKQQTGGRDVGNFAGKNKLVIKFQGYFQLELAELAMGFRKFMVPDTRLHQIATITRQCAETIWLNRHLMQSFEKVKVLSALTENIKVFGIRIYPGFSRLAGLL